MLTLKMKRIKQGIEYDMGERLVSIGEAIDTIVSCELCWGAKALINSDRVELSTLVFGDKDYTLVTGESSELDFIKELIRTYEVGKSVGVFKLILERIGEVYDSSMRYCVSELGVAYELHLEGCTGLGELIRKVPKKPTELTLEKLTEVKGLVDKLDLPNEDGAVKVLMSTLT